jgi:hypothetical protein
MYDTRVGRRWNLDPKPNPRLSSYSVLLNSPLIYIDILGDTVGVVVTSMAGKPGSGSQGHMALIVGNSEVGYSVFSIENVARKKEYVREDEVICVSDVLEWQAKLSGTEQTILYEHCEDTWDGLMNYITNNAPGVNNANPEDQGSGYDRIVLYKFSTAELEDQLIDYLRSQPDGSFTYEVCSNNCATFTIDSINRIYGNVIKNNTWFDRPNKEFDRLKGDQNWSVYKDDKEVNDADRKEGRK